MTVRDFAQRLGFFRTLGAIIPRQLEDNWCWAACALGVSRFYDPHSPWEQCSIANATLGRSDCCTDSFACDTTAHVYDALENTGNLAWRCPQAVGLATLRDELKRGRPIVARIQFPDIGHFVLIHGYGFGRRVRVLDPAHGGELSISIDQLLHHYDEFGRWSHTYGTQA